MGGAASPPAMVREAMARFDAAYSIRYSSTESGGCGTGTASTPTRRRRCSRSGGRAAASRSASATTRRGPLPDGEVGEVWLRSPTSMSGYWRDDEATASALVRDWLRTGDLGFIDERGCLRLAGRLKEMFIRGGYNVYPAEVEAVLADHPAGGRRRDRAPPRRRDGRDRRGGGRARRPRPARRRSTTCARFLEPKLARYKLPEAIRFVDAIPLTPMQKVDRRRLAAEESRTTP